ncbi:hypothetical protein C8F04DRAFT_1266711 [Mycena alexandri]|uniref:Uncharacterized protein n=1 Tax=Mycena alexandri TaxID=1745969 RepID=A0AAD6SGQ2_9AGAR|nr:hypothetical protein C8F04DRAFT_1266711 [Mycena alexandri]
MRTPFSASPPVPVPLRSIPPLPPASNDGIRSSSDGNGIRLHQLVRGVDMTWLGFGEQYVRKQGRVFVLLQVCFHIHLQLQLWRHVPRLPQLLTRPHPRAQHHPRPALQLAQFVQRYFRFRYAERAAIALCGEQHTDTAVSCNRAGPGPRRPARARVAPAARRARALARVEEVPAEPARAELAFAFARCLSVPGASHAPRARGSGPHARRARVKFVQGESGRLGVGMSRALALWECEWGVEGAQTNPRRTHRPRAPAGCANPAWAVGRGGGEGVECFLVLLLVLFLFFWRLGS